MSQETFESMLISDQEYEDENSSILSAPSALKLVEDVKPQPVFGPLARLFMIRAVDKKKIIDDNVDSMLADDAIYAFHPDPKIRLQIYLEKREKRHNGVLERMNNELKAINCEIADKIEQHSAHLRDEISEFKQVLEFYRRTIEKSSREARFRFDLETLTDYWQKVQRNDVFNLFERIDKFRGNLRKLDKVRTEKTKKVLKEYSGKITDVGFLLPIDVEKLFYDIVEKYDMKMLETKTNRNDFCEMIKVNALRLLKKFKEFLESMQEKRAEAYAELDEMRAKMDAKLEQVQEIKALICELLQNIQNFQDSTNKLVEEYKKVRSHIFWDKSSSMQSIAAINTYQNISDFDLSPAYLIDVLFSDDYIWSYCEHGNEDFSKVLQPFSQQLESGQGKVTEYSEFLDTSNKIWNEHTNFFDAECRRVGDEIDEIQENLSHPDRFQTCKDIIVEIRTADTENNIKELDDQFLQQYNSLLESHNDYYEQQFSLVNQLRPIVDDEMSQFKKDCENLMKISPKTTMTTTWSKMSLDSCSVSFGGSVDTLAFAEPDAETHFGDMIKMSVKIIESWKNGIIDAVEPYVQNFDKELLQKLENYITEKTGEIEVQKADDLKRIQELDQKRSDVKDIRTAELLLHSEIFERHEAALKRSIDLLTDDRDKYMDNLDSFVTDLGNFFDDCLDEIQDGIDRAKILEIENHVRDHFYKEMEKMKKREDQNVNYVMQKLSYLQYTNNLFINKLIDFDNGGNFSSGECEKYEGKLDEFDELIESTRELLTERNYERIMEDSMPTLKEKIKFLLIPRVELTFRNTIPLVLENIPEEMNRILKFSRLHLLGLARRNKKLYCKISNPHLTDKSTVLREVGVKMNCHIERLLAYGKFFQYYLIFKNLPSDPASRGDSADNNNRNYKSIIFSTTPQHVTIDGNGQLSEEMNIFHAIGHILWKKFESIERYTKDFEEHMAEHKLYCIESFYNNFPSEVVETAKANIDKILPKIDQHCLEYRRQLNKFNFILNKFMEMRITELHSFLTHSMVQNFEEYAAKFKKQTDDLLPINDFVAEEEKKYDSCMKEATTNLSDMITNIFDPSLWEKTQYPDSQYNIIKVSPLKIEFILNEHKELFKRDLKKKQSNFEKYTF